MQASAHRSSRHNLRRLMLAACVIAPLSAAVLAHDMHDMNDMHGMAAPAAAKPPAFVASTAKPFDGLMGDAMNVMDYGMKQAPMNGNADHDFVTMMLPHHQGAVDMAKAVLLYSQDPEIRNLALGVIAEQNNEIQVMQAWLKRHGYPTDAP
ncbi:DUF305 domain-containing protein [Herbaspirillum sp. LeCh32-8]|uniref:DUF305 domain-containing protein n=1 Tax=Herbaspirillum sp. LeCh32-8 TaxID=2821356 RepID=UPI001AE567B2|nr:DUF305 domain-containing protein [Herbaspirillum sp. LeCh32-8]MBP0596690.1 DUF305 domain-containing protein [Herbaspirillum sp. LeCh32-8]